MYDFRDVDGKTVLVRRVSGTTYYDTYYVYDDCRRLRYVLQPGYQDEADLSLHAFCYTYDERGRCTELKQPGAEAVYYTYDGNDLLLFSQDGLQRDSDRVTFYLYDGLHRLAVRGECAAPSASANAVQSAVCTYAGPGLGIGNCGYTFPFSLSSPVLQLVNFYDDYSFRTGTGFSNTNFPAPVGNYSCGKKTGSIVYVPGQDTRLYKAYYYSMRGNLIREVSSNLRGGYDTTETTYSFTDRPSHSTHTHTAQNAPTLTEAYDYTYDHADRLTKVEHTFGGVKQTLLAHTYDELCRLSHTDYHGSSANRLTYSYNLRGWLTAISGSKFSQSLYYTDGPGTPCYNGNISSTIWQTGGETTLRGYKFTYDGLNRMLDAVYGEGTNIGSNANRFTEKVTGYDKNGNILALQRYGQTGTSSYGLIDNLTFTLDGNQLNRVDDAVTSSAYNNGFEFKDAVKQANEYAYDANGNLTKDLNKNISNIQYNSLNLPSKVTFTDGSTIEYTYAADGTKLRTKHVINGTTTTTDYCGNVIYENGVQKLLLTEAGYVTLADSKYHYFLQDHQGNNRVVIDQNGTVEETNHYYPFGGVFANSTSVQPYKYNGKELDTKKGLNWYDYGARHYDAALGRFHTQDRFAEKYYPMSPYQYAANCPMRNIDVNGDSIIIAPNPNGLIDEIKLWFGFDTKYQSQVKADLKQLKDADSMVKDMIEGLEISANTIVITDIADERQAKGQNGNRTYETSNGTNSSSQEITVEYSPYNTLTNNQNERPPIVGLVHELGHAAEISRGNTLPVNRGELKNGSIMERSKLMYNETYPIIMENRIRKVFNLNMRNPKGYLYGK